MKFSKGYGNSILLVICIIISTTLNNLFLHLDYSLSESYLLGFGISTIIFVITSFVIYFIIKTFKKVTGIVISNVSSLLIGKNIIFDVIVDDSKERVTCFQSNKYAKLNDNETLYLSKRNILYREKTILLFKPVIMILILLLGIGIIFLSFYSQDIFLKMGITYTIENIEEAMHHIILFKFINLFFFGSILLLYNAVRDSLIGKNKVEATIINTEEVEAEEEISKNIKYHDNNVDRIVYRYIWNGEVKIFTPLVNNAKNKKVGTTIKLNVDDEGTVVRETLDIVFFFLGSFIMFLFYIVLLFSFLSDIF